MAPRGRPKKNPFEDLDDEYKSFIEGATDEEIRHRISEVAINEVLNQEAKGDDQDLAEKLEAAKGAGLQYKEASAMNKARIGYAKTILEARGK